MKKLILIVIILLAQNAMAQQLETGTLSITEGGVIQLPQLVINIEEVSPEPVEPGEDVTVKIRLENTGGSNARNVRVTFDAAYPFKFKTKERSDKGITLCAGCSRDNTYYLKVDEEAVTGIYPLNFNAFIGNIQIIFDKKVNINVRGRPELVFEARTIDQIPPNSKFTSMVTVSNVGTGKARVITIEPQATEFIVLGNNVKTIDTLNPDESLMVPYQFTTSENTIPDVYNIPLMFTYLDEDGEKHTTDRSLGVRVISAADLNLQSVKTVGYGKDKVPREGKPFSIIVRIENVGYGDADYTELELECPFKGNLKAFVGNLEKDEDSPAAFELTGAAGYYQCPLSMKYRDDRGWHETKQVIDVQVYNNGLKTILIAAGILAALIVIIILFRRRE